MTTVSNLQTVHDIYAAFGRGDIPFIMDAIADNAVWEHSGDPALLPFAGTFSGKAEILQFFQLLGGNANHTTFVPSNFREEGSKVINDIYLEGVTRTTGKPYTANSIFTWTFDDNGKISHWKNEGDTSSLEAAFV